MTHDDLSSADTFAEPPDPSKRPQVEQIIGPYHVLRLLGEGGMGSVYLCEQTEPVRRRVALKLIKLGMDSAQVLRRFELERQALAVMSHDSIARVFDCGTTERGQPYFVMEYVKGQPITDYCDRHKLTIDARLALFQQVCAAVQHAHQKGVVHRDLKPSNVLVTDESGRPVPKVIDFGLARATDHVEQQQQQFTELGCVVGTPEYMSPEQADNLAADIDTRTDIYSLGVMLYELLTGHLPFSTRELREAGLREMLRVIREVDPPRPSTRLSSLGRAPEVAASRQTSAGTLQRSLRGDLDWVVLKALDKDRTRRYETANGLARDIQRYLAGEPIEARPPSASYRLRKFVRRNRGVAAATATVALALLIGVVAFAWQAQLERAQRHRAEAAELSAEKRADELQQVASYQSKILQNLDPASAGVRLIRDIQARHALSLERSGVAEAERTARAATLALELTSVNATDAAIAMLDDTVLAPAVRTIATEFADQPLIDATLRSTLGSVYEGLGRNRTAFELFERAHALRVAHVGEGAPETLATLAGVGRTLGELQRFDEAEAAARAVVDGYRMRYGDDHRDTLAARQLLAAQLTLQGKYDDSEPLLRDLIEQFRRVAGPEDPATLGAMSDLGRVLMQSGRYDDAVQILTEASEAQRRAGDRHLSGTLGTLGSVLIRQNKLAEAEAPLRESIALNRQNKGEDHPDTSTAIASLASLLLTARRGTDAEPLAREALERCIRAFGRDHAEALKVMNTLGQVLYLQGKLVEAEPYYREAVTTGRRVLGEEHPDTIVWISNLGTLMNRLSRLDEAEKCFREAAEKNRRLLTPDHPYSRTMFRFWIDSLRGLGRHGEAETNLVDELARIQRDDGEDDPEGIALLAILGSVYRDQGKLAEAETALQLAFEKTRRVYGDDHANTLLETMRFASLRTVQGRHADVIALLEPIQAKVRTAFPGIIGELRDASVRGMLGRARAGLATDTAEWTAAEADVLFARATFARMRGPTDKESRELTRALVELYTAWARAEPGAGHEAQAAEWQRAFDEAK